MPKTNSTPVEPEIKPVVQRPLDRINPIHAVAVESAGAVHVLNHTFRALIGINAIAKILLAHRIGDDCSEPILSPDVEGGLMDALICLSDHASDDIDFFADSAHNAYDRLNKSEVRNG